MFLLKMTKINLEERIKEGEMLPTFTELVKKENKKLLYAGTVLAFLGTEVALVGKPKSNKQKLLYFSTAIALSYLAYRFLGNRSNYKLSNGDAALSHKQLTK